MHINTRTHSPIYSDIHCHFFMLYFSSSPRYSMFLWGKAHNIYVCRNNTIEMFRKIFSEFIMLFMWKQNLCVCLSFQGTKQILAHAQISTQHPTICYRWLNAVDYGSKPASNNFPFPFDFDFWILFCNPLKTRLLYSLPPLIHSKCTISLSPFRVYFDKLVDISSHKNW